MKTKLKKPTDAVALMNFVNAHMAREHWVFHAMAEVAFMTPDFDVSWPVVRDAGPYDAMVFDALAYLSAIATSDVPIKTAFAAGRATERLARYQAQIIVSKRGAPRTDHFYAIAVNLVRQGMKQTEAYTKARVWILTNRKDTVIPTRRAFITHLARLRGNTGVLP